MGVWIETSKEKVEIMEQLSHPVWVCGLKPIYRSVLWPTTICHTLYGCVD